VTKVGRMNIRTESPRPKGVRRIDLRRLAEFHAAGSQLQKIPAESQRLIGLALNEAEALAMQTGVPELVLPMLAEEKVQSLRQWEARQERLMLQGRAWLNSAFRAPARIEQKRAGRS